MEPSCPAVFRHEMTDILPHDEDAKRLRLNCFHWAEFFEKHNVKAPKLSGKAVVWGHCHHKATGGMSLEMKFLKQQMGLDAEEAKGGCCGLASSFGFESGKFDISMQCGEIGLLPAARKAGRSTMIIANGFSCQTQLQQSDVGRSAMHTAEVMRIARTVRDPELRPGFPERLRPERPLAPLSLKIIRKVVTVGLFTAAALGAFKGVSKLASRNP